jgi:hypothetical protein
MYEMTGPHVSSYALRVRRSAGLSDTIAPALPTRRPAAPVQPPAAPLRRSEDLPASATSTAPLRGSEDPPASAAGDRAAPPIRRSTSLLDRGLAPCDPKITGLLDLTRLPCAIRRSTGFVWPYHPLSAPNRIRPVSRRFRPVEVASDSGTARCDARFLLPGEVLHKGPWKPFSKIFSSSTDIGWLSPDAGSCAPPRPQNDHQTVDGQSSAASRVPWSIARFASSSAATSAPPIRCTEAPAAVNCSSSSRRGS